MIKAPELETGMIRGYVAVGTHWAGCVGKDVDRDGCTTAYTFWYRHDDDLTLLERDLELLRKAYSAMHKSSAMCIGFETKAYRK